jgi:hypothetical protein
MRFSAIRYRASRNKPCRNCSESLKGNFFGSHYACTCGHTYCDPVESRKSTADPRLVHARALHKTPRSNGSFFDSFLKILSICRKWIWSNRLFMPRDLITAFSRRKCHVVIHKHHSSISGTIRRISRHVFYIMM